MAPISDFLGTHTWLVWLILVLAFISCLLPYKIEERIDNRRRHHRILLALFWSWESGPTYLRFYMKGLHLLQLVLIKTLRQLWAVLHSDVQRRLVTTLKQFLEL